VVAALSAANAQQLISAHDIVLDCTDNVLARYLISDAAVLSDVQVVSGAAQGTEGQLVVLHRYLPAVDADCLLPAREGKQKSQERGPCYRCLFPVAPAPEDVTDCSDGGVLGAITGLVGTMQALETVRLLAGVGDGTCCVQRMSLLTLIRLQSHLRP
jgi:molybdopterin/thiamine biosynthesis adenylyltransferase